MKNKKVIIIIIVAAIIAAGLITYTVKTFTDPYDPGLPASSEYSAPSSDVQGSAETAAGQDISSDVQISPDAAASNPETADTVISDAAYCESKGYAVEVLPGGLLKLNGDSDEYIAGTVAEIDDRMGAAVSYDDVRESISQNDSIKDEYKKLLLEGLDNLEKNGLDMDLRILNYNMKRLEIQELSRSEIMEISGFENTVAFYRMKDGTAVISNDADPEVAARKPIAILHEILGHGATEITLEDKSMRISKLFIMNVEGEGDKRTVSPGMLGICIGEGIADTITYYALDGDYDVTYDAEVFQLEFIRNLLGLDLSWVIDNGTAGIVTVMGEFGFKTPQTYIINMDAETMASHNNIEKYEGVTVSQNVQMLVAEYAAIQSERGISSDEIKAQIEEAFDNSSFDEVVVNSRLRMDVCDVTELKEQILASLN